MKAGMLKFILTYGLVVSTCAISTGPAIADDAYPNRPIHLIVPAAPGGAIDITTRLFAQKMGEKLGQSIIVENRPGGDTLLGTRVTKEAPADGYTILATANGFTLFPKIKVSADYDALKDFTGVGIMLRAPKLMVVAAQQPIHTVAEFVAQAKAKKMTYGSGGVGTPSHLAAETFAQAAGIKLSNVPYKGTGAALPDIAAGRVDVLFDTYPSSRPYIQSGRLRALAVTSSKRIDAIPNVPTVKEQGVDYTNQLWMGLVVRSGTPPAVIQRLSDAMRYASESKDLQKRFAQDGSDPTFMTSAEFSNYLKDESVQLSKLAVELKLPKE